MGAYAGPDVVEDGLVLALDAGNTKSYPGSGTTWTDLSGNGNNGTLVNSVGYNSSNGGFLSFDGSNDYAVVNSSFQVSTSVTYSFETWIYKTSTVTNSSAILISGGFGGDTDGIMIQSELYSGNSSTIIHIKSGNGDVNAVYYNGVSQVLNEESTGTDANFNLNEWIHIAVTGITVDSTDGAAHHIGQNNNDTNKFIGRISNLKVYDRALTASEVQQNYNATRSRYGV